MTSAISARTTKLLKNHVVVGEIRGIPSFDPETDMLDATNSDSINSKREFVAGLTTYTFDTMGNLIRSDAGQTALRTAFSTKAKDDYEIVFPPDSDTSYEFEAYVSSYAESAPHDDVMTFDASFQVTGEATVNTTGSAGLSTPYFVVTGDSSGAITPTPAASVSIYEYKAMADTADTSVTITPTAAAGTIYVNGVTVASGVASGSISLGSTDSYINIFIEVKETSKAPKIYLIEIYRP